MMSLPLQPNHLFSNLQLVINITYHTNNTNDSKKREHPNNNNDNNKEINFKSVCTHFSTNVLVRSTLSLIVCYLFQKQQPHHLSKVFATLAVSRFIIVVFPAIKMSTIAQDISDLCMFNI